MPMIKVLNTRELPWQPVRCFCVTDEQAAQMATQYEASWFYPLADSDSGYFYVLDSEWQKKQQEKKNEH